MDNLIGSLKDAGLCKDVHYKELYIPQAELEGKQSLTLPVSAMLPCCSPLAFLLHARRQLAHCSCCVVEARHADANFNTSLSQ